MKTIDKKQTRKNFIVNMVGVGLYALTSLVFMIIVTRINGMDDAGIFSFGFTFACTVQIIGTYAGRTYQVTDHTKFITDWDYLWFRGINCFLMVLVSVIYVCVKDYELYKLSIIILLVLYKMLTAYSDTIFGIFQKNNNLYQVGISFAIRSLFTVAIFLIVDLLTKDMFCSTCSLVASETLVFILYDCLTLRSYKITFKATNWKAIKLLFVGGFSVFLFFFLAFLFLNIPRFAIDDILTHSDQAVFGIILMPASIISISANFIVQPFVYDISKFIESKDYESYKNIIVRICGVVFLIGVFVVIATYFVGIPILNIIYGIELDDQLPALLVIVVGAIFNGVISVVINALIAIRKNYVQVIIYGLACVVIFVMSYSLALPLGVFGVSIAYCAANLFAFILYAVTFVYYYRKLNNK